MLGLTVDSGIWTHCLRHFHAGAGEALPYIYDLAVQVQHWRKRIATSLLGNLRQIAGVLGVRTLYVQADISDGAAVRLYENFGTKRDVFHFDIWVWEKGSLFISLLPYLVLSAVDAAAVAVVLTLI